MIFTVFSREMRNVNSIEDEESQSQDKPKPNDGRGTWNGEPTRLVINTFNIPLASPET